MVNAKEISRKTLVTGEYLKLEEIEWQDSNGVNHKWEAAERVGGASGAIAIAHMQPSNRMLLIRQYRPPIKAYEVGFPAGTIDPGEKPENAVVRELKEETGYTGTVKNLTPLAVNTAGLSSESCYLVEMDIDENLPENIDVKQSLEEDEEIEVFLVEESMLLSFINTAIEKGDRVGGKFMAYLLGKGFDFSQIKKASVKGKESEMRDEDGAAYYESEDEALQHLSDITGKTVKIPVKADAETDGANSTTSSDIGDSLRSQGESVSKKFEEAASAIDKAMSGVESAVSESNNF